MMNDLNKKNKFLIVVDGSYAIYVMLFGAVREFQTKFPTKASYWLKPIDTLDQDNLPDLLACTEFRQCLKKMVMKRLESIENVAKQNFQYEIDISSGIDIVFAMDDRLKKNFRLEMYPEYKAQRKLVKRQYQIQPIREYIVNVLFKELNVEDRLGYKMIKVSGAEGDDVIATVLMNFKDNYIGSILIASDHDFLQIDGVREFDMFGKEAKRELGGVEVSTEDFLLGKILMGDKSDNIKQVFSKCGPKTALKLTRDKENLKNMLKENNESSKRFLLNKKIISFKEIPEELSSLLKKSISEALYENEVMNPQCDLRNFMMM